MKVSFFLINNLDGRKKYLKGKKIEKSFYSFSSILKRTARIAISEFQLIIN